MKNRKGYSFIEAIIAVAILSSLIVLAINVTTSSADSENTNRDYLIADLMSVQTSELVESLYKTNAIKFGIGNLEECALMLPTYTGNSEACGTAASTEQKLNVELNYVASFDANQNLQFRVIPEAIIDEATNQLNSAYAVYETENQYYNQPEAVSDSDKATKFHRKLIVSNDDGLSVEVTVAWIGPSGNIAQSSKKFNLVYE